MGEETKEEKVKICQYCKRALINENPQVCLLCKKVLCSQHIEPEAHQCERVDWSGMAEEQRKFNEKRIEEMRKFSKEFKTEWTLRWWARQIAWLILIMIAAFLFWSYLINKSPSPVQNNTATQPNAMNISNETPNSTNENLSINVIIPLKTLQPIAPNFT